MKTLPIYISFLLLALACEDPIELDSRFDEPQLVVDAWLRNDGGPQSIVLSQTVDYFAGDRPPLIPGAQVEVCNLDDQNCFTFDDDGSGTYTWNGGQFGQVGDDFELRVEVDGQTYTSITRIGRTTRIDSIGFEFEEESITFPEEGFYGQVYAFDEPGRGDTYWIRAYKNDTLLNRPSELQVVWDATFDAGADIDGTYFIPPIRFSVNALDEDGAPTAYQVGDSLFCEVLSISQDAFRFLNIAAEQITNEGIFATPVANAPGNIFNEDTGDPILGIFNIAEVAALGRRVEE
ncbi:MAG: DUF4249 domain-containing protein [Bacteroidota bacterium]